MTRHARPRRWKRKVLRQRRKDRRRTALFGLFKLAIDEPRTLALVVVHKAHDAIRRATADRYLPLLPLPFEVVDKLQDEAIIHYTIPLTVTPPMYTLLADEVA